MGKISIPDWRIEVSLEKMNGEPRFLWKAVGVDGEVLDFYATETSDEAAARQFFEKALKDPWPPARAGHASSPQTSQPVSSL